MPGRTSLRASASGVSSSLALHPYTRRGMGETQMGYRLLEGWSSARDGPRLRLHHNLRARRNKRDTCICEMRRARAISDWLSSWSARLVAHAQRTAGETRCSARAKPPSS
jgi:hypothetical protein